MSDLKSFEPLWGAWRILEPIGEGSFGKVYRAERTDFGKTYYAAIKHISIPANESQKKEALEYGFADGDADLSKYFESITENLMQEIALMYEVKGNTNIVSYEDHLTVPKPDKIGYDVFIRMELLNGLNEVMRSRTLPESEVIKLGIDMCSALEVCAAKNIIHRDIKPANIFVGANGEYKLGDFGIARRLENTTSGMSKKGTYAYMAPEIYRGEPANLTADIYSLGLVMHRLLNDNRAPFMPIYPAPISAIDHENAMLKRISGSPIPPPAHASAALANIISKATQFDIRKRFAAPGELKSALIQMQKGEELDSTILLPLNAQQNEFTVTVNANDYYNKTDTEIISAINRRNIISIDECYEVPETAPITELHLGSHNITNISQLAKLTDLRELYLEYNQIYDISPLAKLTNLTSLYLCNNKIRDFSPLAKLTKLSLLDLSSTGIYNISILSNLTDLKWLDLSNNIINDISPLLRLKRLNNLRLVNCGIPARDRLRLKSALPLCDIVYKY